MAWMSVVSVGSSGTLLPREYPTIVSNDIFVFYFSVLKSCETRVKMVHNYHEHGSNLHPAAPTPLQRALARNHLGDILRAEPRALPPLHVRFLPAVYPLPADLPGRASTSASEPVPGYFPRGSRDAD